MDAKPFLRGVAFEGTRSVPYPRANPADAARLPLDTWAMAQIPAGVRLELTGDAAVVEIAYATKTGDLGFRGDGAGRTFALWRGGAPRDEAPAALGEGTVRLRCGGPPDARAIVYFPEGMRPIVTGISAHGGSIEPAPPQPRWVCYGDSIAEGHCASAPALSWPAIVGRSHGLDLVNMGYAGAARGEIVSAENVASLAANVISITHGTNCWSRIPHSVGMFREGLIAFLDVVRQGHPTTPILVASPIVRPDAEQAPNALGATLADLRRTMEEVVGGRIEGGDKRLRLVAGRDLVAPEMLADDVHPDDAGHRALAAALGPVLRGMLE